MGQPFTTLWKHVFIFFLLCIFNRKRVHRNYSSVGRLARLKEPGEEIVSSKFYFETFMQIAVIQSKL